MVESDLENVQRSWSDAIMGCGAQAGFPAAFFLPDKKAGSITALERMGFSKKWICQEIIIGSGSFVENAEVEKWK